MDSNIVCCICVREISTLSPIDMTTAADAVYEHAGEKTDRTGDQKAFNEKRVSIRYPSHHSKLQLCFAIHTTGRSTPNPHYSIPSRTPHHSFLIFTTFPLVKGSMGCLPFVIMAVTEWTGGVAVCC